MHSSRRRYKIYICSVILGELEAFRNFNGFSVIFPKSLDATERFTKVRVFSYSSLPHILESENFRFLFLRKLA